MKHFLTLFITALLAMTASGAANVGVGSMPALTSFSNNQYVVVSTGNTSNSPVRLVSFSAISNKWNSAFASAGAFTNANQIFTNTIVVNPGTNDIANGILLTNAVKLAGTMATASRPFLVRLMPGKYGTPTNTYPSVMMSVDNVSTYWEPGAEWWSGTEGGDTSFMWDDTAGLRTNVHIYGRGRFWYTNDGGNVIYLENASKLQVQARSMYATNSSSTAAPFTWGGAACELTFDIDDYIESGIYDAMYGDVSGGQKIRGWVREVRAKGDLFEFTGDSPAWGNIDVRFDIGKQTHATGQPTFLQLGGRTKVSGSQIFVTSTTASMGSGADSTNGILEGFVVQMPANGTQPAIRGVSNTRANMHLRNMVVYGPTNVDMVLITNTAAGPLTLENCSFFPGWASTNWARGLTPSFIRVLGGLNLNPYKPIGSQITLLGTNYTTAIRNEGSFVNHGAANIGGVLTVSNTVNVLGGDITTDQNFDAGSGTFDTAAIAIQANLPNGTGPWTPADGDLSFDSDFYGAGRGSWFSWDGTANIALLHVLASDTPSNGQVPTWNTGGTITWETPSSGSSGGGTNFPNVNLLLGGTNLTLSAGVRKAYHNQTNGSHGINLNLAVPESGYVVTYSVSNSSASDIIVTFYTNSVAANPYDIASKTNVNTFTAAASAITKVKLTCTANGLWLLDQVAGPAAVLKFSDGIIRDTNGANGLDITLSTKRLTNYAHATTVTINGATDVDMTVTNDLSAGATYTISTPTIGSSGVVRFRPDGSARTVAFQTWPAAIVPLSTNRFSNVTNIDLAASKWAYWNYDIARGTNGTTNCFVWVIQAP